MFYALQNTLCVGIERHNYIKMPQTKQLTASFRSVLTLQKKKRLSAARNPILTTSHYYDAGTL